MNRDEHLFDKIEAYLRGDMAPADVAAFEAEIAADPALADLVKTHRLERHGLEWLVERDLRAKMNTWEREAEQARPAAVPLRPSFVRRWWAVGAAAALLLGIFGWWMLRPQENVGGPPPMATAPKPKPPVAKPAPRPAQKPPASRPQTQEDDRVAETPAPTTKPSTPTATVNYSALAAAFYRESDFIQPSTGGSNETPGYGQALDNYKSGKYSDAEKLLKPNLKTDPNALKTKELLAHSLYRRGQYYEALSHFRQLSVVKDKAVAERSEWAMALTLLHQMPAQRTLLSQTLNKISAKPSHAFYGKAKDLKAKLK